MGEITDIDTFEVLPNAEVKKVLIHTRNTVDAADTIAITLANYGIDEFIAINGWKHTTDGSVVVEENPTTAVSSGTLTITVPAGTDDDTRVYEIIGLGIPAKYS